MASPNATVTDQNEFSIEYDAVAVDKTTVVNFTTHTFFNLAGQGKGDVLDHVVTINADNFTPVDKTLIATGEIWSVKNTPMDFTDPEKLGSRIEHDYDQLKFGGGYDAMAALPPIASRRFTVAYLSAERKGAEVAVRAY